MHSVSPGNEWGEIIIADRQIRISEGPSLKNPSTTGGASSTSNASSPTEKEVVDREYLFMRGDHDKERMQLLEVTYHCILEGNGYQPSTTQC